MKFSQIAVKASSKCTKEDVLFAGVEQAPFRIFGVFKGDDGRYHRMPLADAERVSPGVRSISMQTAGGRIRFATDSPYIVVKARLGRYGHMYHFPACGNYGFDVYDGRDFKGLVRPIDRPIPL